MQQTADLAVVPLFVTSDWVEAFRFAIAFGGSPSPKIFPIEKLRCFTGREGNFETSYKVARLRSEPGPFGRRGPKSVSSSPAK